MLINDQEYFSNGVVSQLFQKPCEDVRVKRSLKIHEVHDPFGAQRTDHVNAGATASVGYQGGDSATPKEVVVGIISAIVHLISPKDLRALFEGLFVNGGEFFF